MEAQVQPVTPLAIGIRYGLLLAVSALLVDFLVRVARFGFMAYGIAATLGITVVSLVWITKAHSAFKLANSGMMTLAQGVTIAVVMLLISGLASGVFNYIFLHYIDPDFVERMKDGMVEFMERNNVPDDQIEKSTAKMGEMKMNFGKSVLKGLTNGLVGGIVLGLVVSAFTKRAPSEFE